MRLGEGLEDALDDLGGHPDPGVGDRELDELAVVRRCAVGPTPDRHGDRAAGGELDRVADQVGEHLAQPQRVGLDPDRNVVVDAHVEAHALGGGLRCEQLAQVVDGLGERERLHVQLEPPGLDLGEVEQVVEHHPQRLGGPADGSGEAAALAVEVGGDEQLGEPEDAVDGRAQLVAHAGDELGAHLEGAHRGIPRRRQLGLGLLARRDVAAGDDDGPHVLVVEEVGPGGLDGGVLAVGLQHPDLAGELAAGGLQQADQHPPDPVDVIGVRQLEQVPGRPEVARVAEDRLDVAGGVDDLAVAVDERDGVRDVLEHPLEAVLTDLERGAGLLAIGEVAEVEHDAPHRRLVEQVGGDGLDDARGAVGPQDPELQRHGRAGSAGRVQERLDDDVVVLGVHEVEHRGAQLVLHREPGQGRGRGRGVGEPPSLVDGDHGVGREAQQGLQPLAGQAALGDVLDGADQGEGLAGVVAQHRQVQVAPEGGAVGSHVALVDRHRVDLTGEQGGEVLVGRLLLVGVRDGDHVGGGGPGAAEQLARDPVGQEVAAVERGEGVGHRGVLEHRSPQAVDPEPARQHGQVVGRPRWVCRAVHRPSLGRRGRVGCRAHDGTKNGASGGHHRGPGRPRQLGWSGPSWRARTRSRIRSSRPRL